MQAIGSLATLAQIVVASSHPQALGARRATPLFGWTAGAVNPISQIDYVQHWMLLFVTMQAAICSTCRYLIRILLHKRQP